MGACCVAHSMSQMGQLQRFGSTREALRVPPIALEICVLHS